MSENQIIAKHLCCLYATAPFVQVDDLRHAQIYYLMYALTLLSFLLLPSLSRFRGPEVDSDGYGSMFYPAYFDTRSQDLQEAFHDAGQFYWATPSTWLSEQNIFQNSRPLLIPRWRIQDIDTEEDWLRAEILYQILQKVFNAHSKFPKTIFFRVDASVSIGTDTLVAVKTWQGS